MTNRQVKDLLFKFLENQFSDNEYLESENLQLKKELEETKAELQRLREDHSNRLLELGNCKRNLVSLSQGVQYLSKRLKTNQELWDSLMAKKAAERQATPKTFVSFAPVPSPTDPEALLNSIAVDSTTYIARLCGIKF